MSIYATLAAFGIRRFGDRGFVDVLVQGVPAHIDDVGPEWAFLPPPVDPDGTVMRAVFLVEAGDEKGTDRNGQEYPKPLLTFTGREYEDARFADVIERLERALDAKYGARPIGVVIDPEGNRTELH